MSDKHDGRIQMRLPSEDILAFGKRCTKMNRPYQDVLREMIVAFNEGRLTITPTPELKELYDDRD